MTPDKAIFGGIILTVLLFFLFREILLWYYKIDHRIENQKELIRIAKSIEEQLRQINKHNGAN